jgi:hypothetical protein
MAMMMGNNTNNSNNSNNVGNNHHGNLSTLPSANLVDIITNLCVLTQLKVGDKICIQNQKIYIDHPKSIIMMQSFQRMGTSQSRKTTLEFLWNLIRNTLRNLDTRQFNGKLEQVVCHYLTVGVDVGLHNLKQTYIDDSTICAEIETLQILVRTSSYYKRYDSGDSGIYMGDYSSDALCLINNLTDDCGGDALGTHQQNGVNNNVSTIHYNNDSNNNNSNSNNNINDDNSNSNNTNNSGSGSNNVVGEDYPSPISSNNNNNKKKNKK